MTRGIITASIGPMRIGILVATLVLAHTPASAQDPPVFELSGGYAFLKLPGDSLPLGAFATGSWRATRRIALIAEIKASFENRNRAGVRSQVRVGSLLGGARFNVSPARRLEPFVQALAGASVVDVRVRDTRSEDIFGLGAFDVQLDTADFATRIGGGMTWWLRRRVGAQMEAHYQRTFDRFDLGPLWPGHGANEFGILAGATIGFGGGRRRRATHADTRANDSLDAR